MALTTSAANRARSFSVAPPKASFRPLMASQKNWSIKYPWAPWISTRSNRSRRAASPARPKARIVSAMSFSLMAIPRGSFGAFRPDGLSIGPGGSHLASGATISLSLGQYLLAVPDCGAERALRDRSLVRRTKRNDPFDRAPLALRRAGIHDRQHGSDRDERAGENDCHAVAREHGPPLDHDELFRFHVPALSSAPSWRRG